MSEKYHGRGAEAPRAEDELSGAAEVLSRRIREKGPVTFAEFMEVAMYAPGAGYYTSGREVWGGGGDYITSLDVSPVFARTIATQVVEMWEVLGSPRDFTLIEAGAGRGLLSGGILERVRQTRPALFDAISVRLVEKNPARRLPPTEKITWHEDLSSVPAAAAGVVLSNELIDSFPVHRVVMRDVLKEVYTGFESGAFADVEGEVSTNRLTRYFTDLGIELVEGQKAEVNLAALDWIKKAASLIERGFVATIDYGYPATDLYSPERMEGTLYCHYRHTLNENPYTNIGSQDITTHVDFTSLARAGAPAGLMVAGFTTQKNFLLGLGIADELMVPSSFEADEYEKIRFNRELSRLIAPGGMGDTFKVLIQYKGIDKPVLKGFSFKDLSNRL